MPVVKRSFKGWTFVIALAIAVLLLLSLKTKSKLPEANPKGLITVQYLTKNASKF